MDYRVVDKCRVCKSTNLKQYLDLGLQPLPNNLQDKVSSVNKYPLKVLFCQDCCLSQLSIVINPDLMFKNYSYHSSVSKTFREHCRNMAKTIKPMLSIPDRPEWLQADIDWEKRWFPTVLDIACNDCCLLKEFMEEGYGVLGVDPAENFSSVDRVKRLSSTGEDSYKDMIPVLSEYWSKETAEKVLTPTIRPNFGQTRSVITAQNVFAHVDDLDDFIEGVKVALDSKGIFVAEFPYLPNLIKGNQFDTIYHEHLSYFLLRPLWLLFQRHNIPIFKVEEHPIHGGSIRIYASKHPYPIDPSVDDMQKKEALEGYYEVEKYLNFELDVVEIKDELVGLLNNLRRGGKKVMGYGASAKGISLLNYCGIDSTMLSMIVDDTPQKQDKYTPGSNIPIVDYGHFSQEKPDYILLLAWNFAEELRANTKPHVERGGKYIIPIPGVWVV